MDTVGDLIIGVAEEVSNITFKKDAGIEEKHIPVQIFFKTPMKKANIKQRRAQNNQNTLSSSTNQIL